MAASSDTHCLFDCCRFVYLSILLDAHASWPPASPPPQPFSDINSDKQKYWSELTVVRVFPSICETTKIWLPSKVWKGLFCFLVIHLFPPILTIIFILLDIFSCSEHCLLPKVFSHSVFPCDYYLSFLQLCCHSFSLMISPTSISCSC